MAFIRKRQRELKNGKTSTRWQAIVKGGGFRPITKTFARKADAEEWATAVEAARNRDEYTPDPVARKRLVREMLERYEKTELPKKGDSRNAERHLKFWAKALGHEKISAVSRSQIVQIRDQMAEARSPGTVNRYLATLRHCYGIAVRDWEWARANPCERVMLREPKGRDRFLSKAAVKRLLDACKASEHPQLYPIVLIAVTTGARKGEIFNLRWPDVDLTKGRATLHKTKNTHKRTIALVPDVIAALKDVKKVRRIDDDRLFPPPNPNGKRTFPNFEKAWREAMADAEIEDFRFHDLRHTFASHMAMSGGTLSELAAALGHRTLAMVQRYAHLADSHVHSVATNTAEAMLRE